MKIKFTKMHGAGNDFVVIDAINQQVGFTPAHWQRLADRRFGIGADQLDRMAYEAVRFGSIGSFKKLDQADVRAILQHCL